MEFPYRMSILQSEQVQASGYSVYTEDFMHCSIWFTGAISVEHYKQWMQTFVKAIKV